VAKSRRRPQAKSKPTPKPVAAPGQVGRRPSRPGFLALVGIMWIVVGIIELFALSASWRFVPGILFLGIGVLFLRGAAVTITRHEDRAP
jgi:hypothetical protein